MEIEQLNENIAKSLRILRDCTDDDLMRAARDELSEDRKDLLDALDVLGVYYRLKRNSRNNLIPIPEFAFYAQYVKVLDNPEISEKYDYYREERRIYEKERKTSAEREISTNIQDIMNQRWKEFIQPIEEDGEMKLAASRQSGDDILRNSGNGAPCCLQLTSQEENANGLTLVIRHVDDELHFILKGDYDQIEHITSLASHGQTVPIEEGFGMISIKDFMSEYFPVYIIDDEGNKIKMNIMLDDNGNPLE